MRIENKEDKDVQIGVIISRNEDWNVASSCEDFH